MHWRYIIPQKAAIEAGLWGVVSTDDLAFLQYVKGWLDSKRAEKISMDGKEYVWIDYTHAAKENPLLFSPTAAETTKNNQLSRRVRRLEKRGILETVKRGPRLHFFLPAETRALFSKNAGEPVTKSRETPDTKCRESANTQKRETDAASNIKETDSIEEETIEQTPVVPSGDENVSIETGKRILLQCLDRDPGEQLNGNECRALAKNPIRMTAKEAKALRQFYAQPADLSDPQLSVRKKRFSTLLGDLRGQIALALKAFPPPRETRMPWIEPPLELVHQHLRSVYPTVVLDEIRCLGDVRYTDVIDGFLTAHPQYRRSGAA